MKTTVKVIILAVVMLVGLFFLFSPAQAYTCHKPDSIPFVYDPNMAAYKIIGVVSMVAGEHMRERIGYDDPDDDPIRATLLAGPAGFAIEGQDREWFIGWTPQLEQIGLHYIDIRIIDIPPAGDPLADSGTILIMVYKPNFPPILRWLCSSVLFIAGNNNEN